MKPIFYWFNIERAQSIAVWGLRFIGKLPFANTILRSLYRVDHPSLEREVLGLRFKNPVGMAAGFDVSGEVFEQLGALGFGFVEVGAITPEPQSGNPKPRLYKLSKDKAIMNRIGNPNRGWVYAIERLRDRRSDVVVGCNIARNNNTPHSGAGREFLKCFRNLYQYVDYFTVNINYAHIILDESVTFQDALTELIAPLFEFRRGQSDYRPILLKVSPDLNDDMLDAVSDVLISTPLDGIVAVSGTLSREGLQGSEESIVKLGSGRVSGAPLRERALEVVRHIHTKTEGAYPIIGVGGVMSGSDAKAMLDAGASLVQLYSGFVFEGPAIAGSICRDLVAEGRKVK